MYKLISLIYLFHNIKITSYYCYSKKTIYVYFLIITTAHIVDCYSRFELNGANQITQLEIKLKSKKQNKSR